MKQRIALALAVLLLALAARADDSSVQFDENLDFSSLQTFAIRKASITSSRPELDNPLLTRKLNDTIVEALTDRNLTQQDDPHPDVYIEWSLTGLDYVLGTAGRAWPVPLGESVPQVAYTETTLIIDVYQDQTLIWRGVQRRNRGEIARLVERMPNDAARLLRDYPKRR